jgi:hypothetical protein
MNYRHILFSAVAIIATACSSKEAESQLTFTKTYYVEEYPQNSVIAKSNKIDLDLQGIIDIRLRDTLLFISKEGSNKYISVYNYPSLEYLTDFVYKGNGPGEILYPLYFSTTYFYEKNDSSFITIASFDGKKVDYNITALLNDDEMEFTQRYYDTSVRVSGVFPIGDSTIFYRSLSSDYLQMPRHIQIKNEELLIPQIEILNNAAIKENDGFSFNILSALPAFNQEKGIIAECYHYLNRINMYSIHDPDFSKTIIIGDREILVDDVINSWSHSMEQHFYHTVSYDDCFAALFRDNSTKKGCILLFDWDGNPINKIDLPKSATTFDIDFKNKVIIAYNDENEELSFHEFI